MRNAVQPVQPVQLIIKSIYKVLINRVLSSKKKVGQVAYLVGLWLDTVGLGFLPVGLEIESPTEIQPVGRGEIIPYATQSKKTAFGWTGWTGWTCICVPRKLVYEKY